VARWSAGHACCGSNPAPVSFNTHDSNKTLQKKGANVALVHFFFAYPREERYTCNAARVWAYEKKKNEYEVVKGGRRASVFALLLSFPDSFGGAPLSLYFSVFFLDSHNQCCGYILLVGIITS
jgi:hypothetical protein